MCSGARERRRGNRGILGSLLSQASDPPMGKLIPKGPLFILFHTESGKYGCYKGGKCILILAQLLFLALAPVTQIPGGKTVRVRSREWDKAKWQSKKQDCTSQYKLHTSKYGHWDWEKILFCSVNFTMFSKFSVMYLETLILKKIYISN